MDRIIKLVVAAVVIYLAITKVVPWVQSQLTNGGSPAGESSDEDGAQRCLDRASSAHDTVSDRALRLAQPPIDADAWGEAAAGIRSQISSARQACGCPSEACRTASRALDELDAMVGSIDGAAAGGPPPLNLASRLNEAGDLLRRAGR